MANPPASIRITDVAPRDGLQNEARPIPAADKARLVDALARAGADEVEVSSFVSPKWIPQLGDAAEVFALVARDKPPGVVYSALVPNEKGMEAALAVNDAARRETGRPVLDKISVFTAASETFCRRNTNATFDETLARFVPVIAAARAAGLAVRGYLSTAIACPFEGLITPARVAACAAALAALGVDDLDLGDTIGAGTPDTVSAMLGAVQRELAARRLAPMLTLHLHDTRGQAAACVRAALPMGVRSFDSAAGGLGGCPYASTPGRRAPGNISTETLLATLAEQGCTFRADPAKIAAAGDAVRAMVGV
ncbi:MAG: hydroxymethylglutaryl-CoA lyase [Phycisphaerales bacterium]|nr:hydroxymethylglutaryl-CoA lyase [Phycisphaerales bacterium]